MAHILIVGNINWFNLQKMHIQPLLQAGHQITVLSDSAPDKPEYVVGLSCITLNKPQLNAKAIWIAACQLGKLLLTGKILKWQQRSRLRFLFTRSLLYIRQVERVCERNFDIIHCHFMTRPVCIALYSASVKQPVVTTIHGSDLYVSAKYSISDRDFISRCFARSNAVVVPGSSEQDLAHKLGCALSKIHIIPWGVNTAFFVPPKNTETQHMLKQKWQQPGEKIILSCRNLEPIYNIASVITAFSDQAVFTQSTLVIAGSGSEQVKLTTLCQQLGVAHKVLFTGKLNHSSLLELYQLSDIYVQNPLSDALPYSMLEAIACGLPVVCGEIGNIGQVGRLIQNTIGERSLFFSREGVLTGEHLAQKLLQALNASKRKLSTDQHYMAHIEQHLSLNQHQLRIEQLYRSIQGH